MIRHPRSSPLFPYTPLFRSGPGLRFPEALGVVGFDDIAAARWCAPPLTTVRQPFAEMGETAARILLALVAGTAPAQSRVELGTTLVVRDSTAAPAKRT